MPAKYTLAVAIARFWEKVDKNGPVPAHCPELGPCWLWTACRKVHGIYPAFDYGRCVIDGRQWIAHRFAYTLTYGVIPDGLQCCHRCDTPLCVRPSHLFLSTFRGNMDDKLTKGRQGAARGERNRLAKLTSDGAVDARRRYAQGETQTAIARDYGVTQACIGFVVHRKTWKHV